MTDNAQTRLEEIERMVKDGTRSSARLSLADALQIAKGNGLILFDIEIKDGLPQPAINQI